MDEYGRRIILDVPFEPAVTETSKALRGEGFDLVSTIDIRDYVATDFSEPSKAANPPLAPVASDFGRRAGRPAIAARMTRMSRLTAIAAALACALLTAWPCQAQLDRSLCADCHYANQGKPNPLHLLEWNSSAHEQAGVGCEKCHGGNPATTESFIAHRSIVRGHGPESPVHPASLPRTCGSCHHGPYSQFQKSRHAALLAERNYDGPTCSTCHGYAAGYTLSPRGLDKRCNACHGDGKKAQRPEYAADARGWLQNVGDVRNLLESAQSLIKRTKDTATRASLEHDYQQAEVPLTEAIHDGHAFVFPDARERLGVARARADALLERLARGPGR